MAKFYETSIVLCFVGILLLAVSMLQTAEAASTSLRLKRAPGESASANAQVPKQNSICPTTSPCGWAVYTPFSRTVDYFMQNTCDCSHQDSCVRTDDDLTISAYVYRCRPKQPNANNSAAS